ncbi:hypothetical protein EVAR_30632_1 [Eumeta japonica]|uniref:Uncharacterized protein n=1 Tax=Eumeta variegata TaxID=151549 RepID=A0A4C1VTN9_EUMVA|nr:hypothetical protein EVAR_30632_1 [Eumeta japonica]
MALIFFASQALQRPATARCTYRNYRRRSRGRVRLVPAIGIKVCVCVRKCVRIHENVDVGGCARIATKTEEFPRDKSTRQPGTPMVFRRWIPPGALALIERRRAVIAARAALCGLQVAEFVVVESLNIA